MFFKVQLQIQELKRVHIEQVVQGPRIKKSAHNFKRKFIKHNTNKRVELLRWKF